MRFFPIKIQVCYVQGISIRPFQDLVNFVPAVAYLFCLNLPAAFSQPGNGLLENPCTRISWVNWPFGTKCCVNKGNISCKISPPTFFHTLLADGDKSQFTDDGHKTEERSRGGCRNLSKTGVAAYAFIHFLHKKRH